MFDNFSWLLNVVIRRNGALACGEGSLSDGVATDLGNVSQEFWCAPVFNPRTAEGDEGRSGAQGLPGLQSEFVGPGYMRT